MGSQTMVVTDYHKEGTIGNIQKEGTIEFPTEWFCCTSKRSCESRSCDRISTYRSRKKKKNVGQVPRSVTPNLVFNPRLVASTQDSQSQTARTLSCFNPLLKLPFHHLSEHSGVTLIIGDLLIILCSQPVPRYSHDHCIRRTTH